MELEFVTDAPLRVRCYDTYLEVDAPKNPKIAVVRLYYSDFDGVAYQPASMFALGGVSISANSSNKQIAPLTWKKKDLNEGGLALKNLLEKKIHEAKTGAKTIKVEGGGPALSTADELLKFKQMLDAGIITQDEFDTKKKQLLGL